MQYKKRILFTVLNWGLGHASRCIPIIRQLHELGANISLASDGRSLDLLKSEFPDFPCIELPSYHVHYKTSSMVFNIVPQIPKFLKSIKAEQEFIQQLHYKQAFDYVISDNRYGCYLNDVPSIFITHQLRIKAPSKMAESFIQKMNFKLLQNFNQWWIPDFEGEENLSASLSHGISHPKIRFIGPLSRMQYQPSKIKYQLLAVLSGPEPQRSYFEEKIRQQLSRSSLRALIVQGKTDEQNHYGINKNVELISYLNSTALNQAMLEAEVILSRSGYSTLMDLASLQKKAILVPTPGQTEQEYLAKIFHEKGIFYSQSQSKFKLEKALEDVQTFTGMQGQTQAFDLKGFLIDFLNP